MAALKKDWKFKKQLKHRSIKSKVALELQTNRDYVESKKGKYEDKEIQHSTSSDADFEPASVNDRPAADTIEN